jgi:hypothetical protein
MKKDKKTKKIKKLKASKEIVVSKPGREYAGVAAGRGGTAACKSQR